jgi:DNA gyrase inhibitor GyrI
MVEKINLNVPITVVGKTFIGDYAKSPQFVTEVQETLAKTNTTFVPNKALGVYYDNPEKNKPENLRCFQGVFLQNETDDFDASLTKLTLKGNYLYTKKTGDPAKIVYEGYSEIFGYVHKHRFALKSHSAFQVSTFENNQLTIEFYMEIL